MTAGQRCHAKSPRTGRPCRAWAIRGGTVCRAHGGAAPQVKRRAAERAELAELVAAVPPVSPAQAMLEAAHLARVLLLRLIDRHGPITADRLTEVVAALDRVVRVAGTALSTDAAQRVARSMAGDHIDAELAALVAELGDDAPREAVEWVAARQLTAPAPVLDADEGEDVP